MNQKTRLARWKWMRKAIQQKPPPSIIQEEWEAHFEHMPLRYWEQIKQNELRWHLETIHSFFDHIHQSDTESIAPVVEWRRSPKGTFSDVAVCTWDRHGLFAKVAGSFALAGMNILHADIYTRGDSLVLDLFRVCTPKRRSISDKQLMRKVIQTLTHSLSGRGSSGFPELFERVSKIVRSQSDPVGDGSFVAIAFNNQASEDSTLLKIETPDRLGLLYYIVQILTLDGINIAQAKVQTSGKAATSEFQITDMHQKQITDVSRQNKLRDQIQKMVEWLDVPN